MRVPRRTVAAALVGAAVALATAGPVAHAQPSTPRPVTTADLPRLTAELAAVTLHAQALSAALDRAVARDGGLRVALARLQQSRDDAQWQLDSRARQVYMAQQVDPLGAWAVDASQPDLRELARRGQQAGLTVDRSLVQAVTTRAQQLGGVQQQAEAFRARLLVQARAVLADQDRARLLLAQAQQLVDAQLAGTQVAAERAAAQALASRLDAQQASLDQISAEVTLALTPGQTRRTQQAARDQAPVVALLESSGSGLPAGWTRSGQVFGGTASWYGPGFVGRPTASGAPYDPERLTCANKELPLGTVLHVSANGRAVNCLVNDRGPYVGDRVLDLSRAGSRALGYDGLAQVVVEVLVPTTA